VHCVAMDAGYADLDTRIALDGAGLALGAGVKRDFSAAVPAEIQAWIPPAPTHRRREQPRCCPHPCSLPPVYRIAAIRTAIPEECGGASEKSGRARPC